MKYLRNSKIILCLCGVLCAVALLTAFVDRADSDFGNFSGNSDYGGRSSSSGSSSRSSSGGYSRSTSRSSSSGSSSRNYSRNYSESSGGGIDLTPMIAGFLAGKADNDDECGGDSMPNIVALVFILFIVWKFIQALRNQRKHNYEQSLPQGAERTSQNILNPIEDYLNLDPNFDEIKLREHLANLYVQMQDAWHKKDIRSLRPWFTDAFYNQMDRQLDAFRKTRQTDYTERIAVLDVNFAGYYQRRGMDNLVVYIRTRIVSYVLDDRTGKLVSGDKNREKFMEYEWELTRKSGVVTQALTDGMQTETCPHCGAPLSLNASAQCEYCGSVITVANESWALSNIKGISQKTI